MPVKSAFHSSYGGFDFFSLRHGRTGNVEIVYDDGVARRRVWRVHGDTSERVIGDVLKYAVDQSRVVPALYAELKKRAITVEAIAG